MPRKISYHRAIPIAADARRTYERTEDRQADKAFYKRPDWRRIRKAKLADQPLCVDCEKQGRVTMAEHVHHIIERKDRPDLALDWDNLESVCPSCHNAKRAKR